MKYYKELEHVGSGGNTTINIACPFSCELLIQVTGFVRANKTTVLFDFLKERG